MRLRFGPHRSWKNFLTSAALAALVTPALWAQAPTDVRASTDAGDPASLPSAPPTPNALGPGAAAPGPLPDIPPSYPGCRPPDCPVPGTAPGVSQPFISPTPGNAGMPSGTGTPGATGMPGGAGLPGGTQMPGGTGTPGGTGGLGDLSGGFGGQQGLADAGLGQGGGGQGGLEAAGGSAGASTTFIGAGYVDTAIPLTQYRLRVDAANDVNRADRADFFYSPAAQAESPWSKVNYEEIHNYLEIALNRRFSGWVDIPVRFVDINFTNGSPIEQNGGLSDIQFGFKAAVIYEPSQVVTFQMRTYAPSGNASLGLGRNNWNLEPGILYYQRLGSRLFFEGELLDFIPVAAADNFAGNVLQWGGALSYLVYNQTNFRVAPVTELVGWNVLSGKESDEFGNIFNAAGDTIVNAKFGLRVGFGRLVQPGFVNRADWYVGYGRALTGDVWYKNMFRAELRIRF